MRRIKKKIGLPTKNWQIGDTSWIEEFEKELGWGKYGRKRDR